MIDLETLKKAIDATKATAAQKTVMRELADILMKDFAGEKDQEQRLAVWIALASLLAK